MSFKKSTHLFQNRQMRATYSKYFVQRTLEHRLMRKLGTMEKNVGRLGNREALERVQLDTDLDTEMKTAYEN